MATLQNQRLQDVLSEPGKWTQFSYARDRKGSSFIHVNEVCGFDVTCRCLLGAAASLSKNLNKAVWTNELTELEARLRAAISAAGFGQVERAIDWNDDPARTFDDIRKVAIKYDEMYPVEA